VKEGKGRTGRNEVEAIRNNKKYKIERRKGHERWSYKQGERIEEPWNDQRKEEIGNGGKKNEQVTAKYLSIKRQ
jgi:hypothetical protein